jgi:hypothetical protein
VRLRRTPDEMPATVAAQSRNPDVDHTEEDVQECEKLGGRSSRSGRELGDTDVDFAVVQLWPNVAVNSITPITFVISSRVAEAFRFGPVVSGMSELIEQDDHLPPDPGAGRLRSIHGSSDQQVIVLSMTWSPFNGDMDALISEASYCD